MKLVRRNERTAARRCRAGWPRWPELSDYAAPRRPR